MANYSREDAEKQGKAEVGVGAALIGGIITGILGVHEYQKNMLKKEQIRAEIEEVDKEIAQCKAGLLGSWLNAERISQLEVYKEQLIKEYNKK